MKVFCGECKNYMYTYLGERKCKAEENTKDTWFQSNAPCVQKPRDINRNNDCVWFERKKTQEDCDEQMD